MHPPAAEEKPAAANTSLDDNSEPVSTASADRDEEKEDVLDAAPSSSPCSGDEKLQTDVDAVSAAPGEPAKLKSTVVLTILAICVCNVNMLSIFGEQYLTFHVAGCLSRRPRCGKSSFLCFHLESRVFFARSPGLHQILIFFWRAQFRP
jgi:hypothetical protein